MKRFSAVIGGVLMAGAMASPAQALDCGGDEPFVCLSEYAEAALSRLSLTLSSDDQRRSFNALPALEIYQNEGAEAAVKQWEEADLPVYDLILALLVADREQDARAVAMAAEKPFATDADGKGVKGQPGFRQMQQDLKSYYHGEEDMAYAKGCVSDEAFKREVGGSAAMREGACRVPYDPQAVQRTFGMMQLMRGVSLDQAVEAVMQYAYRVPSCDVAVAIVELAPSGAGLGSHKETAAWKVLDMATICAAELLQQQNL